MILCRGRCDSTNANTVSRVVRLRQRVERRSWEKGDKELLTGFRISALQM